MEGTRREALKGTRDNFLKVLAGHLDVGQRYVPGDMVAEHLDISDKTLVTLAASGEFELGRVAGRVIVDKESLMNYLNKSHFMGAQHDSDPPAVDAKGRIKEGLTLVPEPHDTVPTLKPIQEFAERIAMDKRSFIRHCDIGTFRHYRIGTTYKMSEEDWEVSLAKITSTGMKSNRGRGRPSNVGQRVAEATGMTLPPAPVKRRRSKKQAAESAAAETTPPKAKRQRRSKNKQGETN